MSERKCLLAGMRPDTSQKCHVPRIADLDFDAMATRQLLLEQRRRSVISIYCQKLCKLCLVILHAADKLFINCPSK